MEQPEGLAAREHLMCMEHRRVFYYYSYVLHPIVTHISVVRIPYCSDPTILRFDEKRESSKVVHKVWSSVKPPKSVTASQ